MCLIFTEYLYFNGKFSSSDGKQKCSVGNITKSAGYLMGLQKELLVQFSEGGIFLSEACQVHNRAKSKACWLELFL